jgi:hypothetical protein
MPRKDAQRTARYGRNRVTDSEQPPPEGFKESDDLGGNESVSNMLTGKAQATREKEEIARKKAEAAAKAKQETEALHAEAERKEEENLAARRRATEDDNYEEVHRLQQEQWDRQKEEEAAIKKVEDEGKGYV